MGVVEARHGDATRVRDWRAHGTLDVLAHLGPAVLGDLLEARSLMLREMAALAAERRDEPHGRAIAALAARFAELEAGKAAAPPTCARRRSSTSPSSRRWPRRPRLVFLLILNGIRDVYFEHVDECRSRPTSRAWRRGTRRWPARSPPATVEAARATAFALAEAQRRAVVG